MNKKILLTVLALAVVLLAAPCIGMAHAKPSTTVSGTTKVIDSGFPSEERPAGSNNVIWTIAVTEQWSGEIIGSGSTAESIWEWHHSYPPNITPDFTINIHEKLTFPDVTVLGHSGSMTMEVILFVDMAGLSAHWTILSGTGGLANLHGQGTISGLPLSDYSYTGQVHFDP